MFIQAERGTRHVYFDSMRLELPQQGCIMTRIEWLKIPVRVGKPLIKSLNNNHKFCETVQ